MSDNRFTRTYVEYTVTIAVDVAADEYEDGETLTRAELAARINKSADRWEHLSGEMEVIEVLSYDWVEDLNQIEHYDTNRRPFLMTSGPMPEKRQ